MPWDDELEQLVHQAIAVYGETAFDDASMRALQRAALSKCNPAETRGVVMSTEDYYPHLKDELRRLMTAH